MLNTASGRRVLPNTVMDFHKRRGISGLCDFYQRQRGNQYVTYKAPLENYQIIPASQPSSLSLEFTFMISKYRCRRRLEGLIEPLQRFIVFFFLVWRKTDRHWHKIFMQRSQSCLARHVVDTITNMTPWVPLDRKSAPRHCRKVYQCIFEIPPV